MILNSTGHMAVYRVLFGFRIVEYVIQDSPKMRVLFYSIINGGKRLIGLCGFILGLTYVYAMIGVCIFRHSNPFDFGTLKASLSTMLILSTFEVSKMFLTL
jgi:hypothetical protein